MFREPPAPPLDAPPVVDRPDPPSPVPLPSARPLPAVRDLVDTSALDVCRGIAAAFTSTVFAVLPTMSVVSCRFVLPAKATTPFITVLRNPGEEISRRTAPSGR